MGGLVRRPARQFSIYMAKDFPRILIKGSPDGTVGPFRYHQAAARRQRYERSASES
jgi:hypothetical protein